MNRLSAILRYHGVLNFFHYLPGRLRQLFIAFPALLFQQVVLGRPIILVYRRLGIGDIICSFPAVKTLKRLNPRSIIVYATDIRSVEVVRYCRDVDVIESGSLLPRLLTKVLDPKRVFYPRLPDECTPQPREQNMHLVEEFRLGLGLDSLDEQTTRFEVLPQALSEVKRWLEQEKITGKPIVVIHTGPTWKVREWQVEKWRELTARLQAECHATVIQIGEDVLAVGKKQEAPRVPAAINWIGKLELDQTLALLSVADLCVGIDSGVLHLAGTVNVPIVGIFGFTNPAYRLPRYPHASGVTANVPCLGCHHLSPPGHWREGCPYDIRCMAELSVDEVFAACVKLLPSAGDRDDK